MLYSPESNRQRLLDQLYATGIRPERLPLLVLQEALAQGHERAGAFREKDLEEADLRDRGVPPIDPGVEEEWRRVKRDTVGHPLLAELAWPLRRGPLQGRLAAFNELLELCAKAPGRELFWLRSGVARLIADLVEPDGRIRCSHDLSLHVALLLACGLSGGQGDRSVVFVSSSDYAVQLARGLGLLWDLPLEERLADPFSRDDDGVYDVEVSLPPLNARIGRIPEKTLHYLAAADTPMRLSSEIVAVADAVIHSRDRAVLWVSNAVLFRSVGVEAQLREEVVRTGRLRAVLAVPDGAVIRDSSVHTSIVVTGPERIGEPVVRMVDLAEDPFSTSTARGRRELRADVPWREVLWSRAVDDNLPVVDVPLETIEENKFVLTVDRYLATPATVALRAFLQRTETEDLKVLADFVRPKSLRKVEDGGFVAREAAPGDFGEDGYLRRPAREVKLDESGYRMARHQQVRPGDVLLSIKGTIATVAIVPDDVPDMDSAEIWTAGQ